MARIIHPHICASIRSIARKLSLRRLGAYQHSIHRGGLVSSLIFSLKHTLGEILRESGRTSKATKVETLRIQLLGLKAILVDSEGPDPRFQRRPGDPQVRRCARRPEYSPTTLSKGRLDHLSRTARTRSSKTASSKILGQELHCAPPSRPYNVVFVAVLSREDDCRVGSPP